jgi:hypothetical protein
VGDGAGEEIENLGVRVRGLRGEVEQFGEVAAEKNIRGGFRLEKGKDSNLTLGAERSLAAGQITDLDAVEEV